MAAKIQRVEWTMPYGEDGDDVDLELYVGVRGRDFREWVDRLPTSADMEELMRTLLVLIVISSKE